MKTVDWHRPPLHLACNKWRRGGGGVVRADCLRRQPVARSAQPSRAPEAQAAHKNWRRPRNKWLPLVARPSPHLPPPYRRRWK